MAKYTPRLTCPERSNKYYNSNLNPFVSAGYGMFQNGGNCTCYAWGRMAELIGGKCKLYTGNAETWYKHKEDGYKRGQTPKLGAVICWEGVGKKAGHVAVVEDIKSDGTIVTSNSGWRSSLFYLKTLKPPYNIGTGYKLQGFIYCPIDFEDEPVKKIDIQYQAYDNKKKKWLGVITNYNNTNSNGYAGITGDAIGGIRVRATDGSKVTICSHIKGGSWLGEITKWDDTSMGYSGIKGKPIDKFCVKCSKGTVHYRAHIKGGSWLSWITKYDKNDAYGYAGITGKEIDMIQMYVD